MKKEKPTTKIIESEKTWGSISPQIVKESKGYYEKPEERFRINPQRTLQSLIPACSSLKMVMYVQRVDFIQELFDKMATEKAEIIIGDSVVNTNRSGTEPEVFLRLAELIEEGRLSIRVPKRGTFHEKWILAENDQQFADIFGTANLTSSGSGRSGGQSNQVRVNSITGEYTESPRYIELNKEFQEWYHERSKPYLDDLVNLIKQERDETPTIEIVERWISYTGSSDSADSRKVHALIHEFQEKALDDSMNPDIIVTELTTEANDAVLEDVVKILAPAGLRREGRTIIADTRPFLDQRVSTFPLMSVVDGKISLRVGNNTTYRTADEYDVEEIRRGLEGIHSYVKTLDLARCKNVKYAKMSIYEVMLYFLSSPFHHAYMRQGKEILGWDYERGPKPLAIYGNTKNGKTYLLKYCSRLISGLNDSVDPYDDDDFSATKVKNLLSWSSLFPIIYDDISDTKWGKQYMDQIVRSYWDNWWHDGRNHSQLIVTSNRRVPQGQLKGRMKEVVMDARFEDTTENIRHVSSIISDNNPIFLYFSKMYLELMESGIDELYDHTDSMKVGRKVMEELYSMADMKIPDFFPSKPIETVVDGNGLDWLAMFNSGDAQWKITAQNELHITFTTGADGYEVKRQMDLIPETLGPKKNGIKIILPVPSEFADWLNNSRPHFEVRRLSRRLRKLLKHAN
jgi:hypothetical protein